MPTVTPASASLAHNQTRQFSVSGITSPFWTLRGAGSITQGGLYTAPPAGIGYQTISVHTEVWSSFNPAYFLKNADDTLTRLNTLAGAGGQALSLPAIVSAGDSVEYISHVTNPQWIGVKDASGFTDMEFVYNSGVIREIHPSGNQSASTTVINQGDLIRIEVIAGGKLRFYVNGVLRYTTVNVYFTSSLNFEVDAAAPAGAVLNIPVFAGPAVGLGGYAHAEAAIYVRADILLPYEGLELYCEPQMMGGANGSSLTALTDFSGHERHLAAGASPAPTLQTGVLNGKSVARFNGVNSQPLKHPDHFQIRCGWVVAKYDGAAFPNYLGLISGYQYASVLVSNPSGTGMFYFLDPSFEYRSNDRIYPASAAPGPVQAYKIIFFRYWNGPVWLDGVQLGSDREFPGRLWKGDVALLALYSRDFTEEEIGLYTKNLAQNFALQLADVYPFQADIADTTETPGQTVNLYDPPEGQRIVEVLDDPKRLLELKFSVADEAEARAMKAFHRAHYPEVPCFYRDYRFTPPEDIEGYIDSPYQLDGSANNFEYSFRFREK
jgi:hypothetical protein